VRGEHREPGIRPAERIAHMAEVPAEANSMRPINPAQANLEALGRYLHLLIAQSPDKPAWRIEPGDRLEWRAPVADSPGLPGVTPVFTSLVKAVKFMQAAVLAGAVTGVNKIGKFPASAARNWPFHLVVNPSFESWRARYLEPADLRWHPVDWQAAVRDDE
jgi:hypothetical protein